MTAGDTINVVVSFTSPVMVTGVATLKLGVVVESGTPDSLPPQYRYEHPAPNDYSYHDVIRGHYYSYAREDYFGEGSGETSTTTSTLTSYDVNATSAGLSADGRQLTFAYRVEPLHGSPALTYAESAQALTGTKGSFGFGPNLVLDSLKSEFTIG